MQRKRTDPIIAELRAIREAYAAQFDYDVDAIFRDIRARQEASGREYVRLPARRAVAACEDRVGQFFRVDSSLWRYHRGDRRG